MEGDGGAGEFGDAIEVGGIKIGAELRERAERFGVEAIFDGECAGGSGAGLAQGLGGFEDGDGCSAVVEFERERDADDSGAGDDEVWLGHVFILLGLDHTCWRRMVIRQ